MWLTLLATVRSSVITSCRVRCSSGAHAVTQWTRARTHIKWENPERRRWKRKWTSLIFTHNRIFCPFFSFAAQHVTLYPQNENSYLIIFSGINAMREIFSSSSCLYKYILGEYEFPVVFCNSWKVRVSSSVANSLMQYFGNVFGQSNCGISFDELNWKTSTESNLLDQIRAKTIFSMKSENWINFSVRLKWI